MKIKVFNKYKFLVVGFLLAIISAVFPFIFIPSQSASADEEESGYTLTFEFVNSAFYSVSGYTGTPNNVVIPGVYDDGTNGEYPVLDIGDRAFFQCTNLISIVIIAIFSLLNLLLMNGNLKKTYGYKKVKAKKTRR